MPRYRVSYMKVSYVSVDLDADSLGDALEQSDYIGPDSWECSDPFHLEDSLEAIEIDEDGEPV